MTFKKLFNDLLKSLRPSRRRKYFFLKNQLYYGLGRWYKIK